MTDIVWAGNEAGASKSEPLGPALSGGPRHPEAAPEATPACVT